MNRRMLAVVLAGIVAVTAVVSLGMVGAQDDSKQTYVHEVGPLDQDENGQICAEKVAPNVNRVTLSNTTLYNSVFYHYNTDRDIRVEVPKLHSEWIVLYSDGSNGIVDALAEVGACTPPGFDVECHIVLNEYNVSTTIDTPEGLNVTSGPSVAADPPQPEEDVTLAQASACLGVDLTNSSSDNTLPANVGDRPVVNATEPVDDVLGNVSEPVDLSTPANETVGTVTEPVNDTVSNVTEPVDLSTPANETIETVTEPADENISTALDLANETVDDTTERENETGDPVTSVVDEAVDTVSETVEQGVDSVASAVNGSNDSDSAASDDPSAGQLG